MSRKRYSDEEVCHVTSDAVEIPPDASGASKMARKMEQLSIQPFRSRLCILLADEHSEMRQYLTPLLSGYYEIDAANKASTALTLARERTPDLVVADVTMQLFNSAGDGCQEVLHPADNPLKENL